MPNFEKDDALPRAPDFSIADPPDPAYLTPEWMLRRELHRRAPLKAIRMGEGSLGDWAQIPGIALDSLVRMGIEGGISGLTAPHDAMTGELQVMDPTTGHVSDAAIGRGLDMSGVVGLGTLAGAPAGAVGAGPVWYSPLQREAGKLKGKAPVQQWIATLRNRPGVKPEELEYSGLGSLPPDKVLTHEELMQTLERSGPRLTETVQSRRDPLMEGVTRADLEDYLQNYSGLDTARMSRMSDTEIRDAALARGFRDFREEVSGIRTPRNPQYEQYTLPGGENYREVLVQLAPQEIDPALMEKRAREMYLGDYRDPMSPPWEELSRADRDAYMRLATEDLRATDTLMGTLRGQNYRSGHWSPENIIAHMRVKDRVVPRPSDGQPGRTLFVEEFQSDWHQAGRARGYKNPQAEAEHRARVADLESRREELRSSLRTMRNDWIDERARQDTDAFFAEMEADPERSVSWQSLAPEEQENIRRALEKSYRENAERAWYSTDPPDEFSRMQSELADLTDELNETPATQGVPDAPWKTSWTELMLRRAVDEAVRDGYDQIAWTDGATQNKRYNLSNFIDRLTYTKHPTEDAYIISASNGGNGMVGDRVWSAAELPGVVGREIAERILRGEGSEGVGLDSRVLSGIQLETGGSGMRGFYDDILPKTANKLFKKDGARVVDGELPSSPDLTAKGIRRALEQAVADDDTIRLTMGVGQTARALADLIADEGSVHGAAMELSRRRESAIRNNALGVVERNDALLDALDILGRSQGELGPNIHILEITPAMRERVLTEGTPLFQRGVPLPAGGEGDGEDQQPAGAWGYRQPVRPQTVQPDWARQAEELGMRYGEDYI